jgi:5-hydroxyisourate hydrolase
VSPITTHVLDTANGRPAAGIPVTLEYHSEGIWTGIGRGATGDDGRIRDLMPTGASLVPGAYRITFKTAAYSSFFPSIEITFVIEDTAAHYHIPLLLSPFGYTTYRGS